MKFDLIIAGGKVATEFGLKTLDVCVAGGRIASLKPSSETSKISCCRRINARGRLVLPGIVDPHVHFQMPAGNIRTSDDFRSGSLAAVNGGVTTVIDYTTQPGGVPLKDGLAARMKEASGNMYCDYSFHCIIPAWKSLSNPQKQLRELVKLGIPSFKMFMIYAERGMQSSDADMFSALEAAKQCGALVCVHAESGGILPLLISRQLAKKRHDARTHALSRPDYTEWEAVQRALVWAEATGGEIYFVHLSAGRSAKIVAAARKNGVRAFGETCPQYLTLNDSVFDDKATGHLYASCPQIKTQSDLKTLWEQLNEGGAQTIATDSCSFSKKQKNLWKGDFTKIPYGIPGVETSLPLMYTYGVEKGRITLEQLVELMCLNPAKIMGLYPRKGVIRPGADADMAIINPSESKVVDYRSLKTNCDWNPYQGKRLKGFPETVLLRGSECDLSGGAAPRGVFLRRKRI